MENLGRAVSADSARGLWVGRAILLALGASILEIGFSPENAVHLLTTGAMGTMTLAE